jgi:hypothetical protein
MVAGSSGSTRTTAVVERRRACRKTLALLQSLFLTVIAQADTDESGEVKALLPPVWRGTAVQAAPRRVQAAATYQLVTSGSCRRHY